MGMMKNRSVTSNLIMKCHTFGWLTTVCSKPQRKNNSMVSQLSFWFSSTTLCSGYQTTKMLLPSGWLCSRKQTRYLCVQLISPIFYFTKSSEFILWQHVSPVDERIASSNNGVLKCLTRGCLTRGWKPGVKPVSANLWKISSRFPDNNGSGSRETGKAV